MRPSLGKSSVTVVRSVAGLTQDQLAALVDCSRMSIQAIESGKLRLSPSMAEKISLNTGVCMQWLLANKYRVPPVCAEDPERPYTREAFKMTQAEISNPRVHPVDVEVIHSMVAAAFAQLYNAAIQAYRTDKITFTKADTVVMDRQLNEGGLPGEPLMSPTPPTPPTHRHHRQHRHFSFQLDGGAAVEGQTGKKKS